MPVTENPLTSGGSGTDATSYDTASIGPTANRLVLCAVTSSAADGAGVPSLSGGGLSSWQLVDSQAFTDGFRRVSLFRGMSASPGSGAITISFGSQTQVRCAWAVSEFIGVDTGGTHGSAAVLQASKNAGASGTTADAGTLGSFSSADNATYGCAASVSSGAMTPHTDWTEIHDLQAGAEAQRLGTFWRADNDTTFTCAVGSGAWAAIACELKFGTTPPPETASPAWYYARRRRARLAAWGF